MDCSCCTLSDIRSFTFPYCADILAHPHHCSYERSLAHSEGFYASGKASNRQEPGEEKRVGNKIKKEGGETDEQGSKDWTRHHGSYRRVYCVDDRLVLQHGGGTAVVKKS
ncbi:hypothetical protein J27TS7_56910 [Paenibacillus dendritiformis]|nr:hypothetical protein J27TS7_56910 [Paenibacillus dendritiformis]